MAVTLDRVAGRHDDDDGGDDSGSIGGDGEG